ncbi:MAG: helix-turn-helix domain-containing protein [Chitinophagaceae bacterium]
MSLKVFNSKFLSEGLLDRIVCTKNLSKYKGFGLSQNVRLFIFKQKAFSFSINFTTQELKDNCILIVPPGQLHFMSPKESGDFICIEIPNHILIETDFDFITRLIYPSQKYLQLDTISGFDYNYFKNILDTNNNHHSTLQLLKHRIEINYPNQFGKIEDTEERHLELAREFETMIEKIELFTVNHTIINQYTAALGCAEKTLYRACRSVFRTSPQNILKHHLLMRSIPLLFNEKYSSDTIADLLGYSSINGFMKFIKAQTNTTPHKIRKQLQEYKD